MMSCECCVFRSLCVRGRRCPSRKTGGLGVEEDEYDLEDFSRFCSVSLTWCSIKRMLSTFSLVLVSLVSNGPRVWFSGRVSRCVANVKQKRHLGETPVSYIFLQRYAFLVLHYCALRQTWVMLRRITIDDKMRRV